MGRGQQCISTTNRERRHDNVTYKDEEKAQQRGSAGRGRDRRGTRLLSGSMKATTNRRYGHPSQVSERCVQEDLSRNKVTRTPSKHQCYICEFHKPSPITPGTSGQGVTRNTETRNGGIQKFCCRLPASSSSLVGCSSRNFLKSQRTACPCTE